MTTLRELAEVDIPLWPGPHKYLRDYQAGWAAFAAALETGQVSGVIDPGDVVPPTLSDARRITWIMGFAEHQLGVATWDTAVWGGAPTVRARVRCEIAKARASYLGGR